MMTDIIESLDKLQKLGWTIEKQAAPRALSADILHRYNWIPEDLSDFICETKKVCSPNIKSWFLTSEDFNGTSGLAFAWNAWEILTLDSARKSRDEQWAASIRSFWDEHFPIFISVKGEYAYFAIEKGTLKIVNGIEPVFEETVFVTDSFADLLKMFIEQDSRLAVWGA
jgi:hypothetical protein